MTEVVYLPLKSAGGAVLGHARIAGGVCRLRLRRSVCGQAVVLSDDGTWSGGVEEAIPVRGKLSAVAVLEEGQLLCCGAPQQVSFEQLQRTLVQRVPSALQAETAAKRHADPIEESKNSEKIPSRAEPVAAAVREQPAEELPAYAMPSQPQMQKEPAEHAAGRENFASEIADLPPTVTDGEPPIAVRTFAPTEQTDKERERPVRAVQIGLVQEPPSFAFAEPVSEPAAAPVWEDDAVRQPRAEVPAAQEEGFRADVREADSIVLFEDGARGRAVPSMEDSAADVASFAALLRRAELVFESIESPQPPIIGGRRSAANPARASLAEQSRYRAAPEPYRAEQAHAAGTAAQRSWGEEVDRLLGERPAQTRMPVENPFPHIFPGAVFCSVEGSGVQAHLEGDWVSGGERLRIYAVRGSYSPQPPKHLAGYTRFIRTQQASYWVRVTGV